MEVGKGQKYLKIFEHPFMNLDQEWTKTTITNTVMSTSAGLPPLSADYHDCTTIPLLPAVYRQYQGRPG